MARRSDLEVQRAVQEELEWCPEVDASGVVVAVDGGGVTLSGAVGSFAERLAAKRAASQVGGVRVVLDDITVHPAPGQGRPADAELEESAQHALDAMRVLPGTIRAEVREHIVILSGEVAWDYQRRLASRLVSQLRGVAHVDSRIALTPRPASSGTRERIHKALVRSASLDGSSIDISVLGNTVTLTGRVRSSAERQQAEDAAWSSPHVTAVQNFISIRES